MAMTHANSRERPNPPDFRLGQESTHAVTARAVSARLGQDVVVLRAPHLLDGPAWRQTCLREADRLKASFGSPELPWTQSVSLTAWADKVGTTRAAARAGRLVPLVLSNNAGDVLGEISFAIDPRTGVAELSIWLSGTASPPAREWAWRQAVALVLTLPDGICGVTAPVAVPNAGPARMLTELGFVRRATARKLRLFDGTPTDHHVWWLARTTPVAIGLEPDRYSSKRPLVASLRLSVLMALPTARVSARHLRRLVRRVRAPSRTLPADATSRRVRLPDQGFGTVTIDHTPVGLADVRHDLGSSTLEAWVAVNDPASAHEVAQELLAVAQARGVRRLAWTVLPGSAEQVAAASLGLAPEGLTSPPRWAEQAQHELWATVLSHRST